MQLVTKLHQVRNNIRTFADELAHSPELVDRLGMVHAWYIDASDPENPAYGFSKFIGYRKLDAATYLADYKNLNGRSTEWALKSFSEELAVASPSYKKYHDQLSDWLSEFGKSPRNPVRLMLLNPDEDQTSPQEDRRLLDLMIAVADLLPIEQRHDLRACL